MKKKFISVLSAIVAVVVCVTAMVSSAANVFYDANGDGVINMADAVFINQYLSGGIKPKNLDTLDFDGNDIVSYMDSYKIQCYNLGLLTGEIGERESETSSNNDWYTQYFVYDSQTGEQPVRGSSYVIYPSDYTKNNDISTCSVIGTDDRVPDWTKNGVVQIFAGNSMSTGFVVAPHVIATAAHCVYSKTNNKGKTSIRVRLFDTNGNLEHTYNAVETHVPRPYVDNYTKEYDYALITVAEDLSDYMCFELGVALDSAVTKEKAITCTGFPGIVNGESVGASSNKPTMFSATGSLIDKKTTNYDKTRVLYYNADTSEGNSGEPVYVTESYNGRIYYSVIAIHTTGGTSNLGTRITYDLLQFYNNNDHLNW